MMKKIHSAKKIQKKWDRALKIRPKVIKNEPKLRKTGQNWYYIHFDTKND